ncbi:Hpt domain-containing protein, partial [Magnetococcales bacterium HHB-1]
VKERVIPKPDEENLKLIPGILPDELPGIEMKRALKCVAGNGKLLKRLLQEFKDDYQNIVPEMRSKLESGEKASVQRLMHTLKGVSGSLGAYQLQDSARLLETALKEGSSDWVPLLDGFEANFQQVIQGIGLLGINRKKGNETETSSSSKAKSNDQSEIRNLFHDLANQLKEGLSSSEGKLSEIVGKLGDSGHQEILARMEQQVADFDYDEALESLGELSSLLGINLEEE